MNRKEMISAIEELRAENEQTKLIIQELKVVVSSVEKQNEVLNKEILDLKVTN